MRAAPASPPLHPRRPGASLALLAWLVLALVLAGCSSLPFGKKDKDDAGGAGAAAADGPTAYRVEVEAPRALRTMLVAFLDISRFRDATDTDSITSAELDRLIAATPAQARSLLETEGYFNAKVDVSRVEQPGDERPTVRIDVDPGPLTRVRKVEIEVSGELQRFGADGDAEARAQIAEFRDSWPLDPGKVFDQSSWGSAKSGTIARLRADGYASATWASTQAVVDAPQNAADLSLAADSGPLYRMGPIRVEGMERYREQAAANLAPFAPGERFSERLLLDYQERLQRANLFEGAAVEIDPDPATAKEAPVIVRVRELPQHQAQLGVGYSDQTGPRLTLEHTNRKIFGLLGTDWTLRNRLGLGRDRQSWNGDLLSHPLAGGWRNVVGANVQRQESVDQDLLSSRLRVGRAVETRRLDRLIFVEGVAESNRAPANAAASRSLSTHYHFVWRQLDDILLPTQGFSLSSETSVGYATSTVGESGPFGRVLGRLTVYRPFGDWYGTGRVQIGQVIAKDTVRVPEILQFRAGGDDSVRGYAYRSLGPRVGGVVTSGRVLMTASAELAKPIPNLPMIWGAGFVDVGNAADEWGNLRPVWGFGGGIRVRSPVGPLKVDLAWGEATRKLRLHISVGVTF